MSIDHDKVDRVLDAVEPILHDIAGQNRLMRARIERWIWDAPVVVLSWHINEPPPIGRNIAFQVVDTSGDMGSAVVANIEVNAWLDKDGRRHWQHDVPVSGKRFWSLGELERDSPGVREDLYGAFEIVASWTPEDLTKESELHSGVVPGRQAM